MWAALQGQTALAGVLNGESMWSKAQNRATFDLLAYGGSGNEADYADFQRNFAVVTAYNSARDQVLSGHFDYKHVVATLHRAYMLPVSIPNRSEEHTFELQSHVNLVCRLLLEKKNRYSSITKVTLPVNGEINSEKLSHGL